jgi:hypothetical protein
MRRFLGVPHWSWYPRVQKVAEALFALLCTSYRLET